MKKELIYLWINQDENNCFSKQGFNFSPKYYIEYNYENKNLNIQLTDTINIFSQGNIENVSAVIGENGSGKTTLFQYINSLSDTPLSQSKNNGYANFTRCRNRKRKFVAVYLLDENKYEIINLTGENLYYNNETIKIYSAKQFREENFIGHITHIYLTNSEYGKDLNMFHNGIDYITIQNSSLRHIARSFYKKSTLFPLGVIKDSNFNALQSAIIQRKTEQDFQQILDVMFYGRMLKSKNTSFLGKKIKTLRINFDNVVSILHKIKASLNLSYSTSKISEEIINKGISKFEIELSKIPRKEYQNAVDDNLVLNLLFELCFVDDFALCGKDEITLKSAFKQCKDYIKSGKLDAEEVKYYKTAIDEIDWIVKKFSNAKKVDNTLPLDDLAYVSYLVINVKDLYDLFKKITSESGVSFIAKYINIFDLGMSSGERAILNFMSRLDLLDLFAKYSDIPNANVKDNILILIDEIDLYVHPNWQKKIISELIKQLNIVFHGKSVQLLISSHSPIVLSDIPRGNTIYLVKENDKIVVEKGESHPQTFAANIHSLYKNSFFIDNGIGIGDYASRTINEIIVKLNDNIENEVARNELQKQIDIIGEPILKRKLQDIFNTGKKSCEIRRIEDCEKTRILKFLNEQKAEIEKQIKLLGGEDND